MNGLAGHSLSTLDLDTLYDPQSSDISLVSSSFFPPHVSYDLFNEFDVKSE